MSKPEVEACAVIFNIVIAGTENKIKLKVVTAPKTQMHESQVSTNEGLFTPEAVSYRFKCALLCLVTVFI